MSNWYQEWLAEKERRRKAREERRLARKRADRTTFGEETWGISEAHRSAQLDKAKLAEHDLPVLESEQALADWLGIPLTRLRWFTHDNPADTIWHYVRYIIPKRNGGQRVILAPKSELKALQRKVLDQLLARVPTGPSAHGFIPQRSIVTNARPHVGKQAVVNLDLKDFFPSVTFSRVRGLFISLGYSFSVAATLAMLCTEHERESFDHDGTIYYVSLGPRALVQGAPTSPAIANLVARKLDLRLNGLASKNDFTYTRYADDLTFSGNDPRKAASIMLTAQKIVTDEGFTVHPEKMRLYRRSSRQVVTGLVVNETLGTPRQLRRRLRAILHNAGTTGLTAQNHDGRPHYRAYLKGLIAHVHNANPAQARPLFDMLNAVPD